MVGTSTKGGAAGAQGSEAARAGVRTIFTSGEHNGKSARGGNAKSADGAGEARRECIAYRFMRDMGKSICYVPAAVYRKWLFFWRSSASGF